jgi:HAD superfamily hydrolase (TIGR01509 family)
MPALCLLRIPTMIKALIFDLDGTLIDSEANYILAWQKAVDKHQLELTYQDLLGICGISTKEEVEYLVKRLKSMDRVHLAIESSKQIFLNMAQQGIVRFKPGIRELIEFCKQKNIRLALATSTYQPLARKYTDHIDGFTDDDFEVMIFGDMATHGKPDPEIFNLAQQALNVPKEDCLILEDSHYGIMAANRAAIKVAWIKDMVDMRKFNDIQFDLAFESADEVKDWLIAHE